MPILLRGCFHSLVSSNYCLFIVNKIRMMSLSAYFVSCTDDPFQVEAEEQPEISEAYGVTAVPYFVFCKVVAITE
jgi:hypothetical protein